MATIITKTTVYNYEESLYRIEQFMDKSGIRSYCVNHCHGHCCGPCYSSDNACHKNEGRRMACSYFICGTLIDLIFPGRNMASVYSTLGSNIRNALRTARESDRSVNNYANPYFEPYTKKQMEAFSMQKSLLDAGLPTDRQCELIFSRVGALTNLVEKAHRRVGIQNGHL